ncbi:MAG TPA: murein transglycosylase A, partial [Casimicrobiaceae bacterium]|nr:murein transglycosylase A [Casimicrobiaceae bacterium]
AVLAGCAVPPPSPSRPPAETPSAQARLRAADFAAIPGWRDDAELAAWPSFLAGCKALLAQPDAALIWRESCAAAASFDAGSDAAVRAFFEAQFTPYQIIAGDGSDTGTVTGYYEPLLRGSRQKTERYRFPLYAVPDDLLTVDLAALYPELADQRVRGRLDGRRVVPYWPRADIDAGRAPLAGKELAWVDNAVEAFFLQIQGSGRVQLAEGGVLRLGYADQNGQPYRSIGRLLVEQGELPLARASMQGIEAWGREHPDRLPALLDENPSYVFFRVIVPDPAATIDGPIGTLGVPLAAERTIAVDPALVPLGSPIFLATTYPLSDRALQRLVLAQDTGGAIRGPLRADFFWGFGDEAGSQAGRMKQPGRMWLLWPKGVAPPY